MSADNFIAMLRRGNKYVGYHCSASINLETPQWKKCYLCIGSEQFEVDTIEEAIRKCELFGYLEYGYRFVDEHTTEEPEEGFCEICAHNPKLPTEGSRRAKTLGCNCERVGECGWKLGEDCPVHSNKRWQNKVGFSEHCP